MSGFPGTNELKAFRDRWRKADSAAYDATTAPMEKYLALLDNPLLAICHGHVLELATGTGRLLAKIRAKPGVKMAVGLDLAAQMLRAAAAKGYRYLIQGDAESLPFATESFDSVVCTFYSLRDINRPPAYAEVARILQHGGSFGFTLRNYYVAYIETLWRHFVSHGRWPRSLRTLDGADWVNFDLKDIKRETAALEQAGLQIREVKTVRFLPFIRRFVQPGYWSGPLGTKLGSDIIIIADKPARRIT